jgi:uncharacterized membrane protein YccC
MYLRDRLLASDPPVERLRLALRTTAAVVLGGLPLLGLMKTGVIPGPVAVLGTMIALFASLQANDVAPRDRMITAALLPFAGAAGVVFCTFLDARSPVLGAAGFLLVCFPAVWVRRYGPRGFGLGMMALMASFFSLFVKVEIAWLPAALLALLIGGAAAWIVRFFVVPDSPHVVLQAARSALFAQVRLFERALGTPRDHARMQRELLALDKATLAVDQPIAGEAFEIDDAVRRETRLRLLELEVAATREDLGALAVACERVQAELQRVSGARASGKADAPISAGARPPDIGGVSSTTRQAIQITAASTAAMLIGTLIPPHRYFWAVLTAFIVYNQTASRSEALRRTVARTAGTAIGVGFAFLLVDVVRGKHALEVVLAFVCLFAAMYFFRLSYFAFTFFLTAIVAMLYDVVGRPTDQLLMVRLIETVAGAFCGGIAATAILPIDTPAVVRATVKAFVKKLRAGLTALDVASERDLDGAMQEVFARARPLTDRLAAKHPPGVRETLDAVFACSARLRELTLFPPDTHFFEAAQSPLAALERLLEEREPPWEELASGLRRVTAALPSESSTSVAAVHVSAVAG